MRKAEPGANPSSTPRYFQVYPHEQFGDPRLADLSLEEYGAYMRAYCYIWQRGGSVENSVDILRKSCGKPSVKRWTRILAALKPLLFEVENGTKVTLITMVEPYRGALRRHLQRIENIAKKEAETTREEVRGEALGTEGVRPEPDQIVHKETTTTASARGAKQTGKSKPPTAAGQHEAIRVWAVAQAGFPPEIQKRLATVVPLEVDSRRVLRLKVDEASAKVLEEPGMLNAVQGVTAVELVRSAGAA